MTPADILDKLRVPPGKKVKLKDFDPGWAVTKDLKLLGKDSVKERAQEVLARNLKELAEAQELLWASDSYSILVVLQAMDTAGKDGVIKHVFSGVNPQGCQVYSFKKPSEEELDHNFLWRCMKALPERGRIGIFNRSYYEEALVVRVHPDLLERQRLPLGQRGREIWKERYEDINHFERHLTRNGTVILKFFLHISKEEQRRRLLARLDDPEKHWKFSLGDVQERQYWDDYVAAYEAVLSATSTPWAPWFIVPADTKVVSRAIVAEVLTSTIRSLDLKYPAVSPEQRRALARAREELERA
jgi:PPK2 family polyphosphate:nucleotide phosphotransferase